MGKRQLTLVGLGIQPTLTQPARTAYFVCWPRLDKASRFLGSPLLPGWGTSPCGSPCLTGSSGPWEGSSLCTNGRHLPGTPLELPQFPDKAWWLTVYSSLSLAWFPLDCLVGSWDPQDPPHAWPSLQFLSLHLFPWENSFPTPTDPSRE